MDKLKINNQIVQMRKYVKQAKVHVINKLVKEAQLLQNRKGNEIQVEKAKRKAERLLTEIAMIKKIKPDTLSKLAISKALDWKAVLDQKTSTLEDRCLAMLANYEAVQKEVNNFHLNNGARITQIPQLLKEWEEKNQNMKYSAVRSIKASDIRQKKKERILKSKFNKACPLKTGVAQFPNSDKKFNLEKSENVSSIVNKEISSNLAFCDERSQNISFDNKDVKNKTNISSEVLGSCELSSTDFKVHTDEELLNDDEGLNSEEHNSSTNPTKDLLTTNSVKRNFIPKKQVFSQKSDAVKTIKVLDLNKMKDCDEISVADSINEESSEEENGVNETDDEVDPFFLRDGKSLRISNIRKNSSKDSFKRKIVNKKQSESYEDGLNRSERRKLLLSSLRVNKMRNSFESKKIPRNNDKLKKFAKRPDRRPESEQKLFSMTGKRKFDDSRISLKGDRKDTISQLEDKNTSSSQRHKANSHVLKEISKESLPLHPSWEAKKKLNSVPSVPFKGKRIVFNDD